MFQSRKEQPAHRLPKRKTKNTNLAHTCVFCSALLLLTCPILAHRTLGSIHNDAAAVAPARGARMMAYMHGTTFTLLHLGCYKCVVAAATAGLRARMSHAYYHSGNVANSGQKNNPALIHAGLRHNLEIHQPIKPELLYDGHRGPTESEWQVFFPWEGHRGHHSQANTARGRHHNRYLRCSRRHHIGTSGSLAFPP